MKRLLTGALVAALLASAPGPARAQAQTDDILSILQWSLKAIGWRPLDGLIKPGAREVVVAVIDSGIDVNHPDLKGRIWTNPSPDPALKSADLHGWNFLDDNGDIADDFGRTRAGGHGTHVAGIIAAIAGNKVGIAGVAPSNVRIMALRTFKDFSKDSSSDPETGLYKGKPLGHYVAAAVRFAVAHKADIINLSLGWPRQVDVEESRQAIQEARAAGLLVVAAAGNDGKGGPTFPCTYDGVICVANLAEDGQKLSDSSNFGGKVDVVAPGENIVSVWPRGKQSRDLEIPDFEKLYGTSQATPIVAGVLASLYAVNPAMKATEARARLLAGTGSLPQDPKGRKTLFGLVNIARSLDAVPRTIVAPNFKALDDVILSQDLKTFSFAIRIQSYWLKAPGVKLKLRLKADAGVSLDQSEAGPFDLADAGQKGDSAQVMLSGRVADLDADSRAKLEVEAWQGSSKLGEWSADFELSRPVASYSRDEAFEIKHPENPAWEPGAFRGGRGATRLVEIENFVPPTGRPEYFWAEKTRIWFLRPGQGPATPVDVPDVKGIFEVARVALGAETGYVILGYVGKDPSDFALQFSFYDHAFKPWFGEKSYWRLPTPKKADFQLVQDNFNLKEMTWITYDLPGVGKVPVPLFKEAGLLPEPDRPADPYRRDSTDATFHLYYLKPEVAGTGVKLALRAFDSGKFRDRLSKQLDLRLQDELVVQNLLVPAPLGILSAGSGFDQRYLLATFEADGTLTASPLDTRGAHLLSNRGIRLNGEASQGFLTNFDFNRVRVSALDAEARTLRNYSIEYGTEDEPLLGFLGGVIGKGAEANLVLEGAGRVYDFKMGDSGVTQVKPMELEGDQSLSERASKDRVKFTAPLGSHPYGLYVDSTSVRGNRVFVAWNDNSDDNGLKRPIRYTLNFGDRCLGLQPDLKSVPGEILFSLFCRDSDSPASWRLHYLHP